MLCFLNGSKNLRILKRYGKLFKTLRNCVLYIEQTALMLVAVGVVIEMQVHEAFR